MADQAPTQRQRVLGCIGSRAEHGATTDEVVALTGLLAQSCSARVNELAKLRMIRDSGRTRPTRTDRQAVVWVLAHGERG